MSSFYQGLIGLCAFTITAAVVSKLTPNTQYESLPIDKESIKQVKRNQNGYHCWKTGGTHPFWPCECED